LPGKSEFSSCCDRPEYLLQKFWPLALERRDQFDHGVRVIGIGFHSSEIDSDPSALLDL